MFSANNDIFDFIHGNQSLKVLWQLQKYGAKDYVERIQFDYKGIDVVRFTEKDESEWYIIAKQSCNAIDRLKSEISFKKFAEIQEDIFMLKRKFILLNDTVYKPDEHKFNMGSFYYHKMYIKMLDGNLLNGDPRINQNGIKFENRDEYSWKKTFRNLKQRVQDYYSQYGVLPVEKNIEQEQTQKLEKMLKWLEDNNVKNLMFY